MTTKVICRLDKENNFQNISIKNHADYSEKGQDIVCAAISAITNGTINFLQTYYKKHCQIIYLQAEISIHSQANNQEYQLCLRLMLYQLENIANSYPNYLKIKMEKK